MISYSPFYKTLLKRRVTEYNLIYKQGISSNTLYRIRHNKPITTTTLNELCFILSCPVEDILEYREEEPEAAVEPEQV